MHDSVHVVASRESVQARGKVYPRALSQCNYDRSHEYMVFSGQTSTDHSRLCHDNIIYVVWIDDSYRSFQQRVLSAKTRNNFRVSNCPNNRSEQIVTLSRTQFNSRSAKRKFP